MTVQERERKKGKKARNEGDKEVRGGRVERERGQKKKGGIEGRIAPWKGGRIGNESENN